MTRALVLGATGMVGSMVARVLSRNPALEVSATVRDRDHAAVDPARCGGDVELLEFDAARDPVEGLLDGGEYAWIVNAIGAIVPRIDERDPASVARAIDLNAAFPHRLAAALRTGQRVIQIATDGVFRGDSGPYAETDAHDASDIYGRTKSLGEVAVPGFFNLRCSVVGPERPPPESLLGWLRSQPAGATLTGYSNLRWNGVTTLHFASLCEGMITGRVGELPASMHVVPADTVDKAELLDAIRTAFGRSDLVLTRREAETAVDRTLTTIHPEANARLWSAAGYSEPPQIAAMIEELAADERGVASGRG